MTYRKTTRICVFALLLLSLLAVCACALSEGAPAIRFAEESVTMAVKKAVKVAPVTENIEKPRGLKYTWTSGDEGIASVKDGNVKGVSAGETTVTCSAVLPDGQELSCALAVRVVEPVQSLKITTKANTAVKMGEPFAIEYTVAPENATDPSLTWTSSDESVAAVDENGTVTALKAGKVTVSAVTNDGSKKQAKVNLYVPSLSCETAELTVDNPDGATFTVDYYGDDWDNDVTVTADGKCFEYAATREGNRVTFWVSAGSAGEGKLTIRDKKDAKGAVTVPVVATESGIALGSLVTIQHVQMKGGRTTYTVKNNGSQKVKQVCLLSKPRDKDGNLMYMTEASSAGVGNELVFATIPKAISPGGTRATPFNYPYPDATQADVAVLTVELEDGTFIRFAEKDLRWYSSARQEYITRPEGRNNNSYPGFEIRAKAKSVDLGMKIYNGTISWTAEHWGYRNVGTVVLAVSEGSIAEKAGLQPYDMIVAVNGQPYTETIYTLDIGKAQMADTGTMTLTVERYGQEGTFEVELTQE